MTGGVPPEPPASLRSGGTMQPTASLMTGGAPFTEFTVEVNPEDIVEKGADYVRGLLELGVNRVSMGVQSLDDGILRWMNRRHDAAHARQAFRILRDAGVKNISVDLIFGLSQLSEATLAETLREIVAWRPEHVSAYQLSIEEGSALGKMVREGRYEEATQEQCAAQYRLLCDSLHAAGTDMPRLCMSGVLKATSGCRLEFAQRPTMVAMLSQSTIGSGGGRSCPYMTRRK